MDADRCDLAPTPLVLAEKFGRKKAAYGAWAGGVNDLDWETVGLILGVAPRQSKSVQETWRSKSMHNTYNTLGPKDFKACAHLGLFWIPTKEMISCCQLYTVYRIPPAI